MREKLRRKVRVPPEAPQFQGEVLSLRLPCRVFQALLDRGVRGCGWSLGSLHAVCCPALGPPVALAEGHAVRAPLRGPPLQARGPRVCSESPRTPEAPQRPSPRPRPSAAEKWGRGALRAPRTPGYLTALEPSPFLPHVEAAPCPSRGPLPPCSVLAPQCGRSSWLRQERVFCWGGYCRDLEEICGIVFR